MKIEYNGKQFNKIKDLLAETTVANIDKFLFNNEKITLSDFIWLQETENKNDSNGSASNSGDRGSASNSGYSGSASNSGDWGSASNSGYRGSASNSGDWGSAMSNSIFGTVSNKAGLYAMITEFVFDDLKKGEGLLREKIVKQNAKLMKFTSKTSGKFFTLLKNKIYQVVEYDNIKMVVLNKQEKLGYEIIEGIEFGVDATIYNKQVALEDIDKLFVVIKEGISSHGSTIKEAIDDFKYKISNRDTGEYNYLRTTKEKIKTNDIIRAFRVITGACLKGTKVFVESFTDLKEEYTIDEALEILKGKGAYGVDVFEKFIKENK